MWIPVTSLHKPSDGEYVIVHAKDPEMILHGMDQLYAFYDEDQDQFVIWQHDDWYYIQDVTHWRERLEGPTT